MLKNTLFSSPAVSDKLIEAVRGVINESGSEYSLEQSAPEHHRFVYHEGKFYHNEFGYKPWSPPTAHNGQPLRISDYESEHLQQALNHHLNHSNQRVTRREAETHALHTNGAKREHMLTHLYGGEDQPEDRIVNVFKQKVDRKLRAHEKILKHRARANTSRHPGFDHFE